MIVLDACVPSPDDQRNELVALGCSSVMFERRRACTNISNSSCVTGSSGWYARVCFMIGSVCQFQTTATVPIRISLAGLLGSGRFNDCSDPLPIKLLLDQYSFRSRLIALFPNLNYSLLIVLFELTWNSRDDCW